MKRVIYALAALVALCCACSNEEEVLPQQREKLVSYLESSHAPALVEESEADKEARQPFYSLSGSTVYRYIETYYAPGRESRAEVTSTSKVTITFRAYEFNLFEHHRQHLSVLFERSAAGAGLPRGGADPRGLVVRTADARHARRHTKRASSRVVGLSRGRRGGGVYDLQHGLRRPEFRHDPPGESYCVVLHGRERRIGPEPATD